MTGPDTNPPQIAAEDLVGAWQCFQGDGIHGWDSRVLIFQKEGNRLTVEQWLPFEKGKPINGLRLFGVLAFHYSQKGHGLRLSPEDPSQPDVDITPSENGTFIWRHPRTTAGALWFHRTTKSISELIGSC